MSYITKEYYFKLVLLSVTTVFVLIPLGGYAGHHLKFLAAALIYFGFILFFLNKTSSAKETFFVLLIFALPPAILYIPLHLSDFEGTLFSMISTAGHFIGILFGTVTHLASKKLKVIWTVILLASSLWIAFTGNTLWLHKINYGTFTGNVRYSMPAVLTGHTQTEKNFNPAHYQNKILLLDFWHTRCGICFEKFPVLEELYSKYKYDTSILIIAVNKPLMSDSIGEAFALLKKKNYSFPILIPAIDTLPELFDVTGYPTTFLIDKTGTVIFKGDLEKAKNKLHTLLQ